MSQGSNGNSPREERSDIPMWLIVLMLIVAPPIGVFLLIARVIWGLTDASPRKKGADGSRGSVKRSTRTKKKSSASASSLAIVMLSLFLFIGSMASLFSVLGSDGALTLRSFSPFAVLFALSVAAFGVSRSRRRREERCAGYKAMIGDRPYFSIQALAASAGVSYRRARRDLGYMINHGKLGRGAFIDVGKKMLFRSAEAASEYESSRAAAQVEDEKPAQDRVPQDEYRKIILEIRRLNDEIADIAVSDRIYKLEETTSNIFDYVKEHPEKKSSIRMLMNYYLPTTLKLLTSYANIERVGVAGENMQKSKESIEQTLDMLVAAFDKELDRLYESETIDITSDIEVLEQMLKKDGMTATGTAHSAAAAAAEMKEEE